jgi:hypothetical protein
MYQLVCHPCQQSSIKLKVYNGSKLIPHTWLAIYSRLNHPIKLPNLPCDVLWEENVRQARATTYLLMQFIISSEQKLVIVVSAAAIIAWFISCSNSTPWFNAVPIFSVESSLGCFCTSGRLSWNEIKVAEIYLIVQQSLHPVRSVSGRASCACHCQWQRNTYVRLELTGRSGRR